MNLCVHEKSIGSLENHGLRSVIQAYAVPPWAVALLAVELSQQFPGELAVPVEGPGQHHGLARCG